jgi:tRNA A37 threonylcarbamoyladenosine synthetase subunit TsaC/SUA5/YrdC
MLKEVLPGPYTFIFPATNELPRVILEHKKHTWKRKEIGVRIPDDSVLLEVLKGLESPLLVTRFVM